MSRRATTGANAHRTMSPKMVGGYDRRCASISVRRDQERVASHAERAVTQTWRRVCSGLRSDRGQVPRGVSGAKHFNDGLAVTRCAARPMAASFRCVWLKLRQHAGTGTAVPGRRRSSLSPRLSIDCISRSNVASPGSKVRLTQLAVFTRPPLAQFVFLRVI